MYQCGHKSVIIDTILNSNGYRVMVRTANGALSLALLAALTVCPLLPLHAETQWVKARLGSFETISDSGRKSAIQGLSQFEQFRFALGTAMGVPDLRLDPPVRILVFRNAQDMASQGCAGFQTGRDRVMTCTTSDGQLPPVLIRELTRRLLDENFANLPGPMERAIETFFSTVQSNAVHVTWGTAPPASERTREWALLHRLITQPDYAGRAHIYLHNLASGMDSNGAVRSLSEDPAKFNAEIDRYYAAGVFNSAQAPNRPLNPERDFQTTILTSDEGQLMRADMLTKGSAEIYQALLKSGKHAAEAHEGLAVLAMRAGDVQQARIHMDAAREAGTHNVVALTSYGSMEKDSEKAITILKEALTLDPKYAPAHWALGEKVDEPPRRMMEWKQAVALAPRNYDWWVQYAKLCIDQKQYAEAGRAWLSAAQSAPDVARREQALGARSQIDQLRLDDEDAIRRKEAAAKAADIERLKAQARKEIADLEARANTRPLSKEEAAKVVDWDVVNGPPATITGTLVRVDCAGKQFTLSVRDAAGKIQRLLVSDPSHIELKGGDGTFHCGVQKATGVTIHYNTSTDKKKTLLGEVTGIEYR
jgi:tetratricopeptide (TPR) repeat protein